MITFCGSCGKVIDIQDCEFEKNPKYCRFCVDENGKLKSFERIKNENIRQIKTILGYSDKFSENLALKMMSKYPAWKNIIEQEENENED